MANINRDYLVINDVKKSNISLDNGSITFYITDKNTQNIFVNLVINISDNKLIQKYANIENAEDYTLTMHIVKPDNTYEIIQGKLHDKANAIFEFDLPDYCCDKVGSYRCELLTKCYINNREEITTSNKITYKVKSSVLNDLDEITKAPEYPLVIQLFDKLSDIDQYEEDRRANELARQLAEEQRQTRFDELNAGIDNKIADAENRISAKEEAVNTLIADTKADIDNYKVAKDQEIDNYKATKDTEINEAIASQNTAINAQNDRIVVVENNVVAQNDKIDALETKATTHEARITAIEAKNTEQDGRLDIAENRLANIGNDITNTMQPIIDGHTARLDAIEAIDVAQNNRLDTIEVKNQQQDDRLLDIEKVNNRQDIDIKCLYGASQTIDVAKEGNSIYLQNSNNGFAIVDEIKGNTLVNCNKEPNKELILNGNINASGDNTVTITEGVDGGLVDVALEGNTLVNVSKTKDSTAISKAYTVENSGNHIVLQGDIDGNCRPVITGKTLVNLFNNTNTLTNDSRIVTQYSDKKDLFKPGVYTAINNTGREIVYAIYSKDTNEWIREYASDSSMALTLKDNEYIYSYQGLFSAGWSTNDIELFKKTCIILEGDYSDKPIPDYFTGLQSSFEDNLVTQEMVDNGEEVVGNLGKYKVDYKVTGKNKINKPHVTSAITDVGDKYIGSDGDNATKLTLKLQSWGKFNQSSTIKWTKYIVSSATSIGKYSVTFTKTDADKYLRFANNGNAKEFSIFWDISHLKNGEYVFSFELLNLTIGALEFKDFQLEEGDTATSYEPYKEYTKTLYLNSPLLEGDTIEEKDGGIYHVHRSELVTYTEGDEASLITDKVHTLHRLSEPQYELIEQSNLAMPSYANGHLDFNTAVPVEKVDFLPFSEELTYLYANTQYTVQFISDKATTADITLGGTQLLAQSIVAGLNRISITTPATLIDNKLIISGVGANISEVVVTDTDRGFKYFEGMKSVGEYEELEISCGNNTIDNTQNKIADVHINTGEEVAHNKALVSGFNLITNNINPNDVELFDKDLNKISPNADWNAVTKRFYRKDKTYIGAVNDGTAYYVRYRCLRTSSSTSLTPEDINNFIFADKNNPTTKVYQSNSQQLTHEPLRAVGDVKDRYVLIDGKWYIERKCGIRAYQEGDKDNYKTDLINTVYPLTTATYEPIDYNPLEVYSDVTHITTNSTIPTNITVKNHGFNCLLKPSTTYTISSNLGLNTVTTPSTLTEDCLRFMDTDTSDVTTMKNVLVLEGDWTTKADLIPAKFSGIESAFEQEYDAEKGKYKVNVKVANEDKSKENNITFYINEPLRGVGDIKDRVFIKDDKVVVERNCTSAIFDGSDDENWYQSSSKKQLNYDNCITAKPFTSQDKNAEFENLLCDTLGNSIKWQNTTIIPYNSIWYNFNGTSLRVYVNKTLDEFKQWLQQNPTTVVYQLAEPTYEEVEYNDTKLFIESFKNSTLFYNSNVPVTSKLYYSYSVPIVDTVAQTANVTDQQDSMIIDLATQVAVMEMMLM